PDIPQLLQRALTSDQPHRAELSLKDLDNLSLMPGLTRELISDHRPTIRYRQYDDIFS
ncbi:7219_t:CDS:1, partial [Ambispora leptoticha]